MRAPRHPPNGADDLSDHDLLIRIDERTRRLAEELTGIRPRLRLLEARMLVLSAVLGAGGGSLAKAWWT